MSELKEIVDGLLKTLKDQRGTRHALEGHPLGAAEHLMKNRYIKHLYSVLLYDSVLNDEQQALLERLLAGIGAEHDAERYLTMALEISAESIAELADGFKKERGLKYAFALDALVLCHLGKCTEGQAALLAEVFDVIEISGPELTYITAFAKAALLLDMTFFDDMDRDELAPDGIGEDAFGHYTRLAAQQAKRNLTCTTAAELAAIDAGKEQNPVISLLTLKSNSEGRVFKKGENNGTHITFQHCHFELKIQSLQIIGFEKAIFKDCTFKNFENYTVVLQEVAQAVFLRCGFENCAVKYNTSDADWLELGGVINSKAAQTIISIISCNFTNCGGINGANFYRTAIITNGTIGKLTNSTFVNCWHCRSTQTFDPAQKDPEDSRRVLFVRVKYEKNNKVIDSANLY